MRVVEEVGEEDRTVEEVEEVVGGETEVDVVVDNRVDNRVDSREDTSTRTFLECLVRVG